MCICWYCICRLASSLVLGISITCHLSDYFVGSISIWTFDCYVAGSLCMPLHLSTALFVCEMYVEIFLLLMVNTIIMSNHAGMLENWGWFCTIHQWWGLQVLVHFVYIQQIHFINILSLGSLSPSLLCSGKALVVCSSFLEIYLPLLKHFCYVCARRRRNQVDMQGHIHLLRKVHILEKAILHHLQQDMQQPLLIQEFLQGPL